MRVGLDFDGVIHSYTSGWTNTLEPQDPPVEGAQRFVEWLLDMGAEVVIITARIREAGDGNEQAIRDWLKLHDFPEIKIITNIKLPCALYVGKWMIRFEGNFNKLIGNYPPSEKEKKLRAQKEGSPINLSDGEWGYLGGLIDGEGCITAGTSGKGNTYIRMMVANQHHMVLKEFQSAIGGSVIKTKLQPNHKFPVYSWTVSGCRLKQIFEPLLSKNLLKMKHLQAKLALQYFKYCRYDGRPKGEYIDLLHKSFVEGIRSLNQTGGYLLPTILVDDRGWRFEGDFTPLYTLLKNSLDPGTWVQSPNEWGIRKRG